MTSTLTDPLPWGGLLGALAVVLGAFGAHYLESRVSADALEVFNTAARYHLIHAVLLVVLGVSPAVVPARITLSFLLGVLVFSGSLYAIVFTGVRSFGMVAPLGGTLLILGWVQVAWWGWTMP